MVTIRGVRAEEVSPLRDLRLRALADSPAAFAATVAEEGERPETDWVQLAAESERAHTQVVLVAIEDERWVGMAAARWFDEPRGIVALWSMWVAPELRGTGTGARLVVAVREWAASVGARFVRAGVIEGDADAGGFYERLGFVRTGETRSLTRDPSVGAYFLARPV